MCFIENGQLGNLQICCARNYSGNNFYDFLISINSILQIVLGCIGLFGNLMCLVVFSQKLTLKCFHHLMMGLAVFDSLYILMAILLFGIPTVYIE